MKALLIRLACCSTVVLFVSCATGQQFREPLSYVDPNIGGVGHLLQPTLPTVQLPNSMVRVSPLRTPGVLDKYLATKIYEFPLCITSHRIADAFALMPVSGDLVVDQSAAASDYDHDQEEVTPYYYRVLLESHDIVTEYTVSERAEFFRFHTQRPEPTHILFRSHKRGMLEVVGDTVLRGYEDDLNVRYYFYAVFDKPFGESGTVVSGKATKNMKKVDGKEIAAFVSYAAAQPKAINVRIGISFISLAQAEMNLRSEIPDWGFEKVKERAKNMWGDALNRIVVEGGSEKQRRIFYTAMYRAHERMVNISENGRYYSPFDNQVHEDGGHPFYVDDWLWDTYRSLHSLQMLLNPARQQDMIRSYIWMYEQEGWVPAFPLIRGDHACMIGQHAASLVADAYMKGLRDYDVEKAYEGLKKTLTQATLLPWANGPATELDSVYFNKGFFPALAPGQEEWVKQVHPFERRQAVAVTLETAYDDWCMAQLAKALGKTDDYSFFSRRAKNYVNVFNSSTGFMSPKTADGKWIEPFDPKLSGGQGGRAYFAECNSWTYTWSVQHDIRGLMNLMGGREKSVQRLDQMFNEGLNTEKFFFLGQFPDASGLNGQFAMGDEPSFHIPYLYNYAGAPWKAQKALRQLMNVWFDDDPLGLCGDEDGGALSSWFVFNAMGFYPVTPGMPIYNIGSPIFEKTTIRLENGRAFEIVAKDVSSVNKYVQSAVLNGRPLDKPWFKHAEIINGGSLVLQMGPRPNKQWGSRPEDAPPSMSDEQEPRQANR